MKLPIFKIPNKLTHVLQPNEYYFLGLVEAHNKYMMKIGYGYNENGRDLYVPSTISLQDQIKPFTPNGVTLKMPPGISLHKSAKFLKGRSPLSNTYVVCIYDSVTQSVNLLHTFNSYQEYEEWVEANSTL